MKRRIAILGSTGSIGTQALEVIRNNPKLLDVEVLTAHSNAALLIRQALEFKPNAVVIANESHYEFVKESLDPFDIKVYAGYESINQIVAMESIDMVLAAMVGFAGLHPVLNAIKFKKPVALANKETLVVAGEIVTETAAKNGVNILPVDSEHSAIFQCLAGEWQNPVEKVILTASGGPFLGWNADKLANVTPEAALNHPNWKMGSKVTIDSASLMNKGLEMIEAKWLFGLKPSQIEVIVHPQSIIHSLVQFTDGVLKAQLGLPDMRLPIQYALAYPERLAADFGRFDFTRYPQLTFSAPDTDTFRCLTLAYSAIESGGNMPCIMNAADEVAVHAFLNKKIGFLQIAEVIEKTMGKVFFTRKPSLDDLSVTDQESRRLAEEIVGSL